MLTNSGTQLVLTIFGIALVLLLIFLLLLAILGKKHKKGLAPLKAFSLIFAIVCMVSSVVTPLVYYNYIDINLRYGQFRSNYTTTYYSFHRDSVSIHINGASEGAKGTWTLEDNILTVKYSGVTETFKVREYGTEISKDNIIFKYTKDTWFNF